MKLLRILQYHQANFSSSIFLNSVYRKIKTSNFKNIKTSQVKKKIFFYLENILLYDMINNKIIFKKLNSYIWPKLLPKAYKANSLC